MDARTLHGHLENALALHRAGQWGLADSHYARVLKHAPQHAEAWHWWGVLCFQMNKPAKAIKHYRQALQLRPGFAQAWNNLALALKSQGEWAQAQQALERALQAQPGYADAAFNLGLLHEACQRLDDALRAYAQVLAWQPGHAGALTNAGQLHRRQRRLPQAHEYLARAHRLHPGPDTAGNLALVLMDMGLWDAACDLAQQAAQQAPDSATWWEVLGSAARLQGDADAALDALRCAVACPDASSGAWFELALAADAAADHGLAAQAFARARVHDPHSLRLRCSEALSLPAILPDAAAGEEYLNRLASALDALDPELLRADPREALDAVSGISLAAMHYWPHDTTALQARWGLLLHRTVARAFPQWSTPLAWRPGARLRVGFVSAYLGHHTVARFFTDFISALPAERFECHVWSTGGPLERATVAHMAPSLVWKQAQAPLSELAADIRNSRLDILVFPDVGLDPRQQVLAALYLAPRQVVLYGHPVTTGLPTLDAFVSGAALEPQDAQRFYTEPLWQLPDLGACPQRWRAHPAAHPCGVACAGEPVLLCTQNLSKVIPEFDLAVAHILANCAARLVLFDRGTQLSKRYLERLSRTLSAHRVDAHARVTLLPVRGYDAYLDTVRSATLVLDTPWFSGGGTSLDALGVGTPVVAWCSGQARGRQTAAMLRLSGGAEWVCSARDAYVERVLQALCEPQATQDWGRVLGKRSSVLFEAPGVREAWALGLEQLGAQPSPNRSAVQ